MRVRDVQAGDFPAIADVTNHYIARTPIHFGLEPVTAGDLRAIWESHPRHPYIVLDAADAGLVAYAKAGVWRERAAYNNTAEVGIYVHHDHHGRGHGRRLYRELIERCRGAGFHTLVGGITLPNAASVALHARLGFTHVGTFREVGRKFEAWHDVAFYQLMM